MAGLNTAQIKDRARQYWGRDISDDEANQILNQFWDQSQFGADEGSIMSYFQGGSSGGSTSGGSSDGSSGGFSFDWDAAEKEAFEKLKPYYEEKLKQAEGDTNRAKRIIEEDYSTGTRRIDEDYQRQNTVYQQDYQAQNQQHTLDTTEETRDTRGALNARGVLLGEMGRGQSGGAAPVSGYAKDWFINPMQERQGARKLAMDRAFQRQGEVLGVNTKRQKDDLSTQRGRGLDDQARQLERYKKLLEEEKQNKAVLEMAPLKYQREYEKYRYLKGY